MQTYIHKVCFPHRLSHQGTNAILTGGVFPHTCNYSSQYLADISELQYLISLSPSPELNESITKQAANLKDDFE